LLSNQNCARNPSITQLEAQNAELEVEGAVHRWAEERLRQRSLPAMRR
jgi:hypothetical protein